MPSIGLKHTQTPESSFVVPKVDISDVNTDSANNWIFEELSSYHNETMTALPAETEYVYYYDDSIVSIFVRIRTHDILTKRGLKGRG